MEFDDLAVGPAPQLPVEAFQARRQRVAERLHPDQVLVAATHGEQTYSNDVHRSFRPQSDFWYLTGFAEPGSVLAIEADGTSHLWLRPRDPKAEVWNGRRLGIERAEVLGIDRARDIKEISADLKTFQDRTFLGRAHHRPRIEAAIEAAGAMEDGGPLMASLRVIKDADEAKMLQQAADIGVAGMSEGLAKVRPGAYEYEVEAALIHAYRRAGSTGPGYPPIVGAGDNAAILHYIENRRRIGKGELVLIDAGCEWGYYNSDITRTIPSDEASDLQARLYQVVAEAQQAGLAQAKPGNRLLDVHDAAVDVLVDGLVDEGFLDEDKESIINDHTYRAFYMHGTSHFLGLDVHDVGGYKDEEKKSIKLEPGMCITVEPGLYFNPDFAQCPEPAAGIGIRIEDDVLITEDGHRNLTTTLPRDLQELQQVML